MFYRNRNTDLQFPPGYNPTGNQIQGEVALEADQNHLILKKSWDIALGPIKQVLCTVHNTFRNV